MDLLIIAACLLVVLAGVFGWLYSRQCRNTYEPIECLRKEDVR